MCCAGEQEILVEISPRQFLAQNPHCTVEAIAHLGASLDTPLPLCRCKACHFLFAGEVPEAGFLGRLYAFDPLDDIHASLRPGWTAHLAGIAARILRAMAMLDDSPKRILDFGCGHGSLVRFLNATGGDIDAFGFDHDNSSVQFLKRKKIPALETLDACRQTAPYDAICLNEVLEHVPAPRALLRFLFEITKPGGLLFLAVPPMPAYYVRRQIRAIKQAKAFDPAINLWEHLNYFSGVSLSAMAHKEGWIAFNECLPQDVGFRPDLRGKALVRNLLQTGRALAEAIFFSSPRVTACFFQKPPAKP